jgi:4-carboxymuconolactone decarboxylase
MKIEAIRYENSSTPLLPPAVSPPPEEIAMTVPRIAPLEPPYAPDLAKELAAMMPPGVDPIRLFRTLAHNPRVLSKVRLGNLLDRGSLSQRDREIVILRTTARCGAEYEWGIHVVVFSKRVGLTEAQVAATHTGADGEGLWSPSDRALLRMVDQLHSSADLDEALWQELRAHFDDAQLIELVVLAGFYHTISFMVNAFRIEAEPMAARLPR